TDPHSRVLARSLDPERYIGTTAGESRTPPQAVAQTQVLTGVDGVRRVYGNAVVDRGPWLLSVGIPTRVPPARTGPQWGRSFFIADAAICFGLLMALYMSTRTGRGIDRVHKAVQRIANGDLSPPERGAVPNLELARLQEGFITMAANLRDTHHALDRQIEQERQTREALQSLQPQVGRQERPAAAGAPGSG